MRMFRRISPLIPAFQRVTSLQPVRAAAAEVPQLWRRILGQQDEPPVSAPSALPGSVEDRRQQRGITCRECWDVAEPSAGSRAAGTTSGWRVAVSGEVKGNPTESEAYVWADRTDEDPLPPGLHHTISMPAGEAAAKPTDSEERVAADRSEEDPLMRAVKPESRPGGYC